jgi:NAD(P)-dependent dehydrogenase (short-subunit alcohol dehydrogenase family)
MHVLVTGGYGAVGRAAVMRLAAAGFSVKVVGIGADFQIPAVEYAHCDITDYAHLRESVRGCEAIVHLAAVTGPALASSPKTFEINAQGTFNVFRAAEEEGIRRVVQASSINATGQFYGLKPVPLAYLPLDEDHPVSSTDIYSFTKQIAEEIGDYFWRRSGISSVALRFPWVAPVEAREYMVGRQARSLALCERLLKLSPEEHKAWFERAWKKYNELRALGINEDHALFNRIQEVESDFFAEDFFAMSSRVNFFVVVDERDSARAIELGLTAPYEGSHALFINDDHNHAGVPSSTLAKLLYPDVTVFKKTLVGSQALVSIERARALLGFTVEHSFVQPTLGDE